MEENNQQLVVHIIYRLAVGGLENGLVNIINRMPVKNYRHVIICLSDYTDFRNRITKEGVDVYALHKKPGKDLMLYFRLWSLLRGLKADIVHTRNMGTVEMLVPAVLAGIKCRVHGEHGRDTSDLDGTNKKYIFLRKLFRPLVCEFIALSKDIEGWLVNTICVNEQKLTQIYNGVDTAKFRPKNESDVNVLDKIFEHSNKVVICSVGRMQGEKDQITLVKAFLLLLKRNENYRNTIRLVLVGNGPLREEALALLRAADATKLAWLPGSRDDADRIMRASNIFVLPSLTEGVSNTILEAMATGLPVVATNVGGNPELVIDGVTGTLVPSLNPASMADAIQAYIEDPSSRTAHGLSGLKRIRELFSMEQMVSAYENVYLKASKRIAAP